MSSGPESEQFFIPKKEKFFAKQEEEGVALTFNDVRLSTAPSQFKPDETDIRSRFSRNVDLKLPFVSAAMDTVTESGMAIAIAQLGGLGVIHAGLDPDEQRVHVRRVKKALNAKIEDPITVQATDTLEVVLNRIDEKGYDFRTFPVIDSEGWFAGLLRKDDFEFAENTGVRVEDAMEPRTRVLSAKPDITIQEAYQLMCDRKIKKIPLLNEDGSVAGMYVFSDVRRIVRDNSGMNNVDDKDRLRVAAAVPTNDGALERVELMGSYLDVVVIDSAQGDSKFALETLQKLKEAYPNLDVVVGNISSPESARLLADAGADGIKVGQGPGSICTTRIVTGIGTPQVTAVYECKRAVLESSNPDVPVCADGGIAEPGDISIAIAAGADSVMMGSMLAGTEEAPGDIIRREDGTRVKIHRGMGSLEAMRDNESSRDRYGVQKGTGVPLAEGVVSHVPFDGPVVEKIDLVMKALRKSLSYVGAGTIEDHQRNTLLFRVTNAGMRESRPHGVTVINTPQQR